MEDLDFGPDLLCDRALFEALIDEAYSTRESDSMQITEFSSDGTSSPGVNTPPSSSGGQEEAFSPEQSHETQAFPGGTSMTHMLLGIGGSAMAKSEASDYDDSIQDPLVDPSSSPIQPYFVNPLQSSTPAYVWGAYLPINQQNGSISSNCFQLTPSPVGLFTGPAAAWNLAAQVSQQQPNTTSPFAMFPSQSAIPRIQNPTTGTDRCYIDPQESMSLRALQSDDVANRYPELSSNVTMDDPGYSFGAEPQRSSGFAMMGNNDMQAQFTGASQAFAPMQSYLSSTSEQQSIPDRTRLSTTAVSGRSRGTSTSTTKGCAEHAGHSSPRRNNALPTNQSKVVKQSYLPVARNNSTRVSTASKRTSQTMTSRLTSPAEHTSPSKVSEKNRGGRSKGLDGDTRAQANRMRKLGACWICAFQRDQCDEGSPCTRCKDRNKRGSLHVLPCSRIHLQEFVHQFLPATMNRQHRRDATITFVQENLSFWRSERSIPVYLTCHGLGTFTWELHEYEPSTQTMLLQRRYMMGINGTWQHIEKRSPPLALKEVDFTQSHKLEAYVDRIIDDHLDVFQEDAYSEEEETCAIFQTEVLKAMCSLYKSLPEEDDDKNLKGDLRQVLRMLVLTCIMDHPISMSAPYQNQAISMMQNYNNPQAYNEWTSPLMANRQLKYYFSEMQTQQYNKSLNRLHQILRSARDRNKLWMSSFVLVLGIALVLEQCQCMLWLKADHKVAKNEITPTEAAWEARGHCAEIDEGFEFLCKLYHCKYRGKHRKQTRFEEWKNKTSNAAEAEFANTIYDIVDRNGGYLLHRQNLKISGMRENNYFSRLVAKFLVSLMGLDQCSP